MADKKVSEEDFKIIQELKKDPKLIQKVNRQIELTKEQKQYERKNLMKYNNILIRIKRRELEFKRNQLKDKKCVEKHADFVSGVKPLFMLESDLEQIQYDIDGIVLQVNNLNEEFQKEEKG